MLRAALFLIVVYLFGFCGALQAAPVDHALAKEKIQYLLAIDRIDFYNQNLADFLENKRSPELIESLRSLKPEDFYKQNFTTQTLSNSKEWQSLIYQTLKSKNSDISVSKSDLEWNYDFFKNKLLGRFDIKEARVLVSSAEVVSSGDVTSERSIPRSQGAKVLLDTDRYIAEKTTRAIIWDAILNNRRFAFFVGTQADFQNQISRHKLEIVAEVQPMARNYNKIYLAYEPASGSYIYSINLISGDDRIKHLSAQLRLVRFEGKSLVRESQDKVRVYGSPTEFHKRQEKLLSHLFMGLPKADKIVIGQKGAIEEMIKMAGMLDVISKESPDVLKSLQLEKSKASKFENLLKNAKQKSVFLNHSAVPGSLIEKAHELTQDPFERTYKQFNSEQASHEFSDYLLLDKNNKIQRWRVFSAVWGDEIIPIARALKNTGHKDIVYIGTAGAIAHNGLKVGDVVAGDHVYTHSGKVLNFSPGALIKNARPYGVGQVHTPFDETDKWLTTKGQAIDIVEVETGYLREHLGAEVKLESYFLISDVVGSESETLAHAAQASSKRKKAQLLLLENLFVKNDIVAPISNYEMLPSNNALKNVYEKLSALRPSREKFSLLQVAQIAVRQGKSTPAELEAVLKSQPAFTRTDLSHAILALGGLLAEIQSHLATGYRVGFLSEGLLNGTFNPKVKTSLKIVADGLFSKKEITGRIGQSKWDQYEKVLSKSFYLEVATKEEGQTFAAKRFRVSSSEGFYREFENLVLKPAGYVSEVDKSGSFRMRALPGLGTGLRCEAVFL